MRAPPKDPWIFVNALDIKNGKRGDPYFCAVALAVKRRFKMSGTVTVQPKSRRLCVENTGWFRMPHKAVMFARDYDNGKVVMPTQFQLQPLR